MAEDRDHKSEDSADSKAKIGIVKRIKGVAAKVVDRCLTPKFMLSAALASFVIHGCLYWYYANQPEVASREVALGNYRFEAFAGDGSLSDQPIVADAEFDLHISLLANTEARARELMRLRERKLRQAIEELLRQARDREFADPQLVELKRRLHEQINHTLGIKAVDEVLITHLRLTMGDLPTYTLSGDEEPIVQHGTGMKSTGVENTDIENR